MAPRKTPLTHGRLRTVTFCGVTLGALALGACLADDAEDSTNAGLGASGGTSSLGGTSGNGGNGSGSGDTGGTIITLGGGTGGTLNVINPGDGPIQPDGTPYLSGQSGLSYPGIGAAPTVACGTTAMPSPFCDQEMWNVAPAKRVLYSWTTAEQAAELRQDRVLLTRTETPDLGRGYAFTSIDALAARGTAPENQLLQKISTETFVKVRYAWSNAWATRMGWPGEDYGDQLLRITLKAEAWIVVVSDGVGIAVIDMSNQLVPIADALAHPERIGAVYFYKKEITGNGSFQSCSGGYREFIVGNEAMVEEWSLGTQELHDRIESDAKLIDTYLGMVRATPTNVTPATFNQLAVCQWDYAGSDVLSSYERTLAIPSENYAPLPAALATLSDTLRASLFDIDPLTVTPGGS